MELSEKRLQEIALLSIDQSAVGFLLIDSTGRIYRVNDTVCQMTGFSSEELLTKTVSELDPFYTLERLSRLFYENQAHRHISFESQLHRKDCSAFPVEITCYFIDYGGVSFASTFVRDISSQKRVEEDLARSQRMTDAILNHHFQLTGLMSLDGKLIMANETALKLAGVSKEETVGKYFWDTPWWSQSPVQQEKLKEAVAKAAGGEFVRFETSHPDAEGKLHTVDFSLTPLSLEGDGKVDFIIPEGRDITDIKQKEQALKDILEEVRREKFITDHIIEGLPGVFYLIDEEMRLKRWNNSGQSITGYSPAEARGMDVMETICPEDHKLVADAFGKAMRDGSVEVEYHYNTKDGRRILLAATAVRIEIEGKPHVMGFSIDITRREKAEQANRLMEAQLRQSQKLESLGTLVAGIAHEINNPTNVINLNMGLFREVWRDIKSTIDENSGGKYGGLPASYLKERFGGLLEDTEKAGKRIAGIVEGLKNFSRKKEFSPHEKLDLNAAVIEAIKLVDATFRKASVVLEKNLGEALPLAQGDAQGIEQVIINLLVNGLEAIEHDHGTITVTTFHDREADCLILAVEDNGSGIPHEHLEQIFDPFFTSKSAKGGTGLGLSITHGIIKAMQGEISVDSRVGEGTVFKVKLPLPTQS